jgi:hypothetical protein
MAVTTRLLSTLSEEEMVSTKVRLALKYCWYKRIVGTKKPLVPRDYWCYQIAGANNLLVPKNH